jgi:acetyltransferase-like isoleucine patch superfamily enzyme
MNPSVQKLLKDAAKLLPPNMQIRLQGHYRERWSAKLRHDMTLAQRLPQYSIGPHSVGYPEVRRELGESRLTIGDYCSIAGGVTIMLGGEHASGGLTTYPLWILWPECREMEKGSASKGDITIGSDVWIGINTLVLSGSTIGDGAIIGAGSVVRGKIPPYAIAVGSPCRTVMYRFKPDEISTLLAIRWWDWPEDVVAQALPILLSGDVDSIAEFARSHPLLCGEASAS